MAFLSWLPTSHAETAYVYGRQSWWTTSDTLQFLGDAVVTPSGSISCEQWHPDCITDNAFLFRLVDDVNTATCEFDTSRMCYGAGVNCCFWAIGCTGQDIANVCRIACEAVKHSCPPPSACYCKSIWAVRGFNVGPGDDEDPTGCYELELVCETDEPCLRLKELRPCSTTVYYVD